MKMSESSEAAEQMVRMSLEGVEVACRITGSSAKELAVLIYTIASSKEKTAGKAKLSNMIKSGKPLTVFSIRNDDLERFQKEAKTYGILYSALIDKGNKNMDGLVDIVVRKEDAPRINRIVDRFKLATFDKAQIISDINKTKGDINPNLRKTKTSPQSKPFSKNKNSSEVEGSKKKPSVRAELNKYKDEIKNQSKNTKAKTPKVKNKTPKAKERS